MEIFRTEMMFRFMSGADKTLEDSKTKEEALEKIKEFLGSDRPENENLEDLGDDIFAVPGIRFKIKKLDISPIDKIGNLMTAKEFFDCVDDDSFMEDDGYGIYADKERNEQYENKKVSLSKPSTAAIREAIRNGFTHVMWYNKWMKK